MIKILFFIETLTGGGAEKVLRNLVNNMDRDKFEITVQTVWPCDYKKYLVPGIRYKAMYGAHTSFNHLRYRIEAASGQAYRLHIKDDYDIECAYLEAGTTKILAGSTNKRAKKLAWVHCDLKKAVSDPEAFAEKTKSYYRKYDKTVCVSQNVENSFKELFGDSFPTTVVYNVIDDAEIKEKAAADIPKDIPKRRFTIISVGRLAAPKKYMRLLRIHKRLLDEGFAHDLWILGEGPEREKLEKYISENALHETVKLFGFCANPYPFMQEADLVVCSSEYEGYSTFISEAVILGKPIVTTDCGGMQEILGDSEFGMITGNNEEALYEGLRMMLADAAKREMYAQKASQRSKNFVTAQLVKQTEDFLLGLLG